MLSYNKCCLLTRRCLTPSQNLHCCCPSFLLLKFVPTFLLSREYAGVIISNQGISSNSLNFKVFTVYFFSSQHLFLHSNLCIFNWLTISFSDSLSVSVSLSLFLSVYNSVFFCSCDRLFMFDYD